MIERVQSFGSRPVFDGARLVLGGAGFSAVACLTEAAAIVGVSVVTGAAYHAWMYGAAGEISMYANVGGATALLYALPFLFQNEYGLHDYLEGRRSVGRIAAVWTYAFLCLAVVGFLTKTTATYSRGWLVLFYIVGLAAVASLAQVTRHVLEVMLKADRIARRRLLLVGSSDDIARLSAEIPDDHLGVRVVGSVVLPVPAENDADPGLQSDVLAQAAVKARSLNVEDVVILTDWTRSKMIHDVVETFRALPVAIHLGASSVVGPFTDARISRFGAMTAVSLTAPPLSPMQAFVKRTSDVVLSGLALAVLAPVFLFVGLMIRATSPGPAFFLQRRRGYNQAEFKIWKFRTMTTMDDGPKIEQAKPNDQRVTAIGRYLRRFSIDELPQLINVFRGEMSLVGPRPHAVAHDEMFEKRIAAYARRLNVRPGITGWAQVQGHRGLTATDDDMRRRVESDLYYIDNWSIAFDFYILALTVLSPKTYTNAH